jgi:DNA-binding transcriptional MerR regulator
MLDIQQTVSETQLTANEIYQIVGRKDVYTAQDLETLQQVIKLKTSKGFSTVKETLEFIQSSRRLSSEQKVGTPAEETTEVVLSSLIESILPIYSGSVVDMYQAVDKNCSRLTTEMAKLIHHRMTMMATEVKEKVQYLAKTDPPVDDSVKALQEALWETYFRKILPPLPISRSNVNKLPTKQAVTNGKVQESINS